MDSLQSDQLIKNHTCNINSLEQSSRILPNGLKIFVLNVRSCSSINKFDEFKLLIAGLGMKLDVIIITESVNKNKLIRI